MFATLPVIKWIFETQILVIFAYRMGEYKKENYWFLLTNGMYIYIHLIDSPHFNIPMAHPRDPTRDLLRDISRDVRGDLRGISGNLNFLSNVYHTISIKLYHFTMNMLNFTGRLNGTSDMWGQHHNLTQGILTQN